jgi:hypothetical protein
MYMKRIHATICSMLMLVLLAACSTAPEPAQVAPTNAPAAVAPTGAPAAAAPTGGSTEVGKPEAGKATIVGRVVSKQTGAPLVGKPVRMAEVTRQGEEAIYVLDGGSSPGAETDAQGRFVMTNIIAREYVLVIGDPIGEYYVVQDDATRAKVWNATADQILDVGEQKVDLAQ